MKIWLVLARAVHLGACLLFFSVLEVDRLTAIPSRRGRNLNSGSEPSPAVQWLCLPLLGAMFISGVAWFLLTAVDMSGLPFAQAMRPSVLKTVWSQTLFGTVWRLRLVFWVAAGIVGGLLLLKLRWSARNALLWAELSLGTALLGSLAWAGHGLEGPPWHLAADVLHLLAAGFWPAGLLPFVLLLRGWRRRPEQWGALATLLRRFSTLSLIAVGCLTGTGIVNTLVLVGSPAALIGSAYGRWLLVKVVLFLAAVCIGAVNRLRLKPRMLARNALADRAEPAAQMQFNAVKELALGTAIVLVVAVLGILPPGAR
jgi:copper resistance protein D